MALRKVAWHLYLMAQPAGVPEPMIEATADTFFASFLDGWVADPMRFRRSTGRNICVPHAAQFRQSADYRASAGIDLTHDRQDRDAGSAPAMPVTVIHQDWDAVLGYDATGLWRLWATDPDHRTLNAGHFMAEEAPKAIITALRGLLLR